MAILRIRALEVLGAVIERLCPRLEDKVCAGPAEHPKRSKLPSLSIVPVSWNFLPDQDGEIFMEDEDSPTAVFRVGRHEALLQLRIGARSARERYTLEHAVSQIFVSQRRRPGILVVNVTACHNATVAYELERTEWNGEAFSKEWYSVVTVNCIIPALVERGGQYTIQDLRSCLTEDLTTPFDQLPASALECVQINEDGSITASSPTP